MALGRERRDTPLMERTVEIPAEDTILRGMLSIPPEAEGIVVLASSEPDIQKTGIRCARLIRALVKARYGVLLIGLITEDETSGRPLVGVGPLDERIDLATRWLAEQPETGQLPLGYYASETAAAAAIQASLTNRQVRAIVSRGGRLDLAFNSLADVRAPTLLIAEQEDDDAIAAGQTAYNMLRSERKFVLAHGRPDQPGDTLEVPEEVVSLALEWFQQHLPSTEH
jgi:putative phosphoribosyl transferase